MLRWTDSRYSRGLCVCLLSVFNSLRKSHPATLWDRTELVVRCVLLPLSSSMSSSSVWYLVHCYLALVLDWSLLCFVGGLVDSRGYVLCVCLYEFCTCLHPCLYNDNECWVVKPSSVNQVWVPGDWWCHAPDLKLLHDSNEVLFGA